MFREGNYEGKRPLLYLVATPIGNLKEFSSRAVDTLSDMDYIACEDTRNSGLLFAKFGIKKPLISCHEHNEEEGATKIISLLKEGKKVAYVSDAGYPTVSDPGARLVKRAIENESNQWPKRFFVRASREWPRYSPLLFRRVFACQRKRTK